jgi:negative regulator of genetic competence, sporulation and motility
MEWIRISQNKLKIMLTAEDARHYELNCEQADYTDVLTRTAFREILTDVKREADFDASEDKVYIQMYPSKEGGCELFVTKIGLLLNEQQAPSTSQVSGKAAPRARRENALAFRFPSFSLLSAACRRLRPLPIRKSEAFRDEKGAWWLFLSGCEGQKFRFLSGYAREVRADLARLYLAEHGKSVCEKNAVERLAEL